MLFGVSPTVEINLYYCCIRNVKQMNVKYVERFGAAVMKDFGKLKQLYQLT